MNKVAVGENSSPKGVKQEDFLTAAVNENKIEPGITDQDEHLVEHTEDFFEIPPDNTIKAIKNAHLLNYYRQAFAFYNNDKKQLLVEFWAGIELALSQIPETLAFSVIARVDILTGIYSTFFLNIFVSLFGHNEGIISGASLAFAVTIRQFLAADGTLEDYSYEDKKNHLYMMIMFCGLFQVILSIIKIPKVIYRLGSTSVRIAFYNTIAILTFISQLDLFSFCSVGGKEYTGFLCKDKEYYGIEEGKVWVSIGYILVGMVIIFGLQKIPKIGSAIPATLLTVIILTIFEHTANRDGMEWDQYLVKDYNQGQNADKFPTWDAPPPNGDLKDGYEWGHILVYAIFLCFIGLYETINTLKRYEDIRKLQTPYITMSQDGLAQGISNLFCSLFGGMGGSAQVRMTKQANEIYGSKGRISGFIAAWVFILLTLLITEIDEIPLSALGAVLFYYMMHDFNFTFLLLVIKRKISMKEAGIIIVGTAFGCIFNLGIGFLLTFAIYSISESWNEASGFQITIEYCKDQVSTATNNIQQKKPTQMQSDSASAQISSFGGGENQEPKKLKIYRVKGNVFFASVRNFLNSFQPLEDEEVVLVDFLHSRLADCSAARILNDMTARYQDCKTSKILFSQNLDDYSLKLIKASRTMGDKIKTVPIQYQDDLLGLLNEKSSNSDKNSENTDNKQIEMSKKQENAIAFSKQDVIHEQNEEHEQDNHKIDSTNNSPKKSPQQQQLQKDLIRKDSENFNQVNIEERDKDHSVRKIDVKDQAKNIGFINGYEQVVVVVQNTEQEANDSQQLESNGEQQYQRVNEEENFTTQN